MNFFGEHPVLVACCLLVQVQVNGESLKCVKLWEEKKIGTLTQKNKRRDEKIERKVRNSKRTEGVTGERRKKKKSSLTCDWAPRWYTVIK